MTTNYEQALISSLSHPHSVSIDFIDFASRQSRLGRSQRMDWCDFADARKRYASMPYDGDKADLPAQMGAISASDADEPDMCGKKEGDIEGHTWLFIDSDDGSDPSKLIAFLDAHNVAYLITESASSRCGANPLRWHLILALAREVIYQSGIPVETRKTWWMAAAAAAKQAILSIGGIAGRDDKTSNTINRIAYVPRLTPTRAAPVSVKASTDHTDDNRCLDLVAFLTAIGFDQPSPPSHKPPEGRTDRDPSTGASGSAKANNANGSHDTEDHAPTMSQTPGHTTGTLLHGVFVSTGRIKHRINGGFAVACPWEAEHTSQGSSTSSVIFLRDGGGFECKHAHCEGRSAADVLRWARLNHVPMPDRLGFGDIGASDIEAAQEAAGSDETATGQRDGSGEAEEQHAEMTGPTKPTTEAVQIAGVVATPEAATMPPAPHVPAKAFALAPQVSAPPPAVKAVLFEYPEPAERERIEITNDQLADMRDLAVKAIARHPYIVVAYQKGTPMLCDLIAETDQTGRQAFTVRRLTTTHLKMELCRVSSWFVRTKEGAKPSRPDDAVVGGIIALGSWPQQRRIRGIVGTPVFRPGGTLIQTPGHDDSGIFFDGTQCRGLRRVSDDPSASDCHHALSRLRYVLVDFPFEEPDLAAAVWLSAIFTKLLRFAFSGNIPLFAVTAGASGSGKGKVAATASIIATGKAPDTISGHLASADEGPELEREIGAHIVGGDGVIILDNVARSTVVGGPVLESYMTTPTFTTRRIGTSDKIRQEKSGFTDLQMWATGNDLQLSSDMTRRSLVIAINDLTGDPTSRKADQADLDGYVTAHRNELLAHALTLLSGFFAARRKGWKANLPDFASFEAWSIVRQAVVWCGLPDPFLARGRAAASPEDIAFGHLAAHLHSMIGTTPTLVGQIDARLVADATARRKQHTTFRSWLADEDIKIGTDGKSLGKAIKKHVGRVAVLPTGKFKLVVTKPTAGSTVQLVPV